jgi:hypothetical protein
MPGHDEWRVCASCLTEWVVLRDESKRTAFSFVMPGPVPGIHVFMTMT